MEKIDGLDYLTIKESAEYLQMKYMMFYQVMNNFTIKILGGKKFFLKCEVEKYKEFRDYRTELRRRRDEKPK